MGLVTITKEPPRNALGGTLRAVRSEFRGGRSAIEDKVVNPLDKAPTITYIYYITWGKRYIYKSRLYIVA
jgi:hypothetical protein